MRLSSLSKFRSSFSCAKLRKPVRNSEKKSFQVVAFALLFLRRDERMKVSVHPAGDAAGRSFLGKEFDKNSM